MSAQGHDDEDGRPPDKRGLSDTMRAIRLGERHATKVVLQQLRARLGLLGAGRVLGKLVVAKLRGAPFAAMGPPRDWRDRLSRRQCADVVLLERAIKAVAGQDAALAVVRDAVLAGAVPFMDAMLPDLLPRDLAQQAPKLAQSMFNAEGQGQLTEQGEFVFEVQQCRFVELLGAVDAAHLAPLFCEADDVFFDGVRRPVVLHRSQTLATGGRCCDFRFSPATVRSRASDG